MNTRTVNLEIGGTATFTQRGADLNAGFVRVNGKTISGYRLGSKFYAHINGPNAGIVTPSYLLTGAQSA